MVETDIPSTVRTINNKYVTQKIMPKKEKKDKFLPKKILNRTIIKSVPRATVVVESPNMDLTTPMQRDKSRFFKKTWDEEKRSLFFK